MTTITRTAPPCSPTITLIGSEAELVSSLSGDLAEYQSVASAPGQISLITAKSYKTRFRQAKVELKEIMEKKKRLEEHRETLQRGHVYTKILDGKPPAACVLFDSVTNRSQARLRYF